MVTCLRAAAESRKEGFVNEPSWDVRRGKKKTGKSDEYSTENSLKIERGKLHRSVSGLQ